MDGSAIRMINTVHLNKAVDNRGTILTNILLFLSEVIGRGKRIYFKQSSKIFLPVA